MLKNAQLLLDKWIKRWLHVTIVVHTGPALVHLSLSAAEVFNKPTVSVGTNDVMSHAEVTGLGLTAEVAYDRASFTVQ